MKVAPADDDDDADADEDAEEDAEDAEDADEDDADSKCKLCKLIVNRDIGKFLEKINKILSTKDSVKIYGTSKEDRVWVQELFSSSKMMNILVYSKEINKERILIIQKSEE